MHKNIKRFLLSLIFLFALGQSFANEKRANEGEPLKAKDESVKTEAFQEVSPQIIPQLTPPIFIDENLTLADVLDESCLYKYTAMTIEFLPDKKQARWVGYFISKERLEADKVSRKHCAFTEDERIKGGSANDEDYRRSGYDRGHLAPARDMAFSSTTLRESFLFSNISPQVPKFNRGKWSELEKFVRSMAEKYELLYVITGPIFEEKREEFEESKTIGKNKVAVPKAFFKALLFYGNGRAEAVGFIMPNEKLKEKINTFACSIDEAEEKTKIDFFPFLPDEIENMIEKTYDSSFWFAGNE